MAQEDLNQRLAHLNVADEVGLCRLAQDIASAADDAPRAIVHEWARGGRESASKACLVGLQLEELAFAALLDEAGHGPWPLRIMLLQSAVEAAVRQRNLVLLQLDALLLDASALGESSPAVPRPERVCDRACRLIARMFDVLGVHESPLHTESEFADLSPDDQEREMENWRKSNTRAAILITTRRYG